MKGGCGGGKTLAGRVRVWKPRDNGYPGFATRRRCRFWGRSRIIWCGVGYESHHTPGPRLQGVWEISPSIQSRQLALATLKDLGSGWPGGVQHHCHYTRVVRPELAAVPPVDGAVHQLLARVDPCGLSLDWVKHVLLVSFLRHTHCGDGVLRGQHVPSTVCAQYEAPMSGDVHGVDSNVRLWAHYEHVLFTIIGPEIPQRSRHSQEWDLVDMSGSSDGALVTHLGPVPDHTGNTRLADHLTATLGDSLTFLNRFWFVVPGERLSPPYLRVVWILGAQDDGGVTNVTDEDLSSSDESDGCSGTSSTGESTCSLGPPLQLLPHGIVGVQESFVNCFQNGFIIIGPKTLLPHNVVH